MKLVRKGLFGSKNISATGVAQQVLSKENQNSYREIVNSFNFAEATRKLLFQYLVNLSYNMRTVVLRRQLALLHSLSLDDQIKVLNKTISQQWGSLIPAYELLIKNRFDNIASSHEEAAAIDVVDESF